jgi:hypothetical protein
MRVARHSKVKMPASVRKMYPKDYFKRKREPVRVRKFKLNRPMTRTVDRIEMIAHSKRGGDLLVTGMRHRKPNPISVGIMPLSKNPNKIMLYRDSSFMNGLQVFYYTDNPFKVYASDHGELIRIPIEKAPAICKAIRTYLQQTKEMP